MLHVSDAFRQEVLHENEQIYQRISDELTAARSQVLVAVAWFTDHALFQTLLGLLERQVAIRIILADIEDNKKLDFEKLQRKGAVVRKVRQNGYNGMRQRFCVIDRRLAIHGSYNWSISARLKNQESVIVTNHAETVAALIRQFEEMEAEASAAHETASGWRSLFHRKSKPPANPVPEPPPPEQQDQPALATLTRQEEPAEQKTSVILSKINFQAEYASVLDGMIAAEIYTFDKELLRSQGYERAKASNGDAQLLSSAMDTVYSAFISDINVVEDKKRRLIGKIREQQIICSGALENSYQTQLRTIEAETESTRQKTTVKLVASKTQASTYEADIETIRKQKMVAAQATEQEIEAHLKEIEQESIVSKFRWYEFIPVALFTLGLLVYLFLFYSSAAYIFLFCERDAKEAQMNGLFSDPPHVFEPHAFARIVKEGGYALSFVFLFVLIPLAVAAIGRFIKKGFFSKSWSMLLLAIVLDAGIAYKVAASIYEANYLTGNVKEPWQFSMALFDFNFYLVFLLGSLGVFIFHALFGKLISLFEERDPDVRSLQLKLKKEQEKEVLSRQRSYVSMLHESADTFSKELIKIKNEQHLLELELAGLPHRMALSREKAMLDFENNRKVLNDVTAIYISRIESDILPISADSVKGRISVFLEGWTSFLNDQYAVARAEEKARQALEAAALWQQQKLAGHQIDNRIKQLS